MQQMISPDAHSEMQNCLCPARAVRQYCLMSLSLDLHPSCYHLHGTHREADTQQGGKLRTVAHSEFTTEQSGEGDVEGMGEGTLRGATPVLQADSSLGGPQALCCVVALVLRATDFKVRLNHWRIDIRIHWFS